MNADEPTDADLAELLDEARGGQAAAARTTRRWLRQQALEEALLTGVLVSAAETVTNVTVRTTSGRRHVGIVEVVGDDFCAVSTGGDGCMYIRTSAITVVRPDPGMAALPATDGRPGSLGTRFVEALAELAAEQPDVSLVCAGQPDPVGGILVAVGVDVATVEITGDRGLAYVALDSVTEAWVRASG